MKMLSRLSASLALPGLIILASISNAAAEFRLELENTNIVSYAEKISDFNRIRLEGFGRMEKGLPLQARVIVDDLTRFRGTESQWDNDVSLHRAMVEYQETDYSLFLGRQRVPLGVGRIWNPIDVFNPIDITSFEPEEREGTDSLRLEYYPDMYSSMDFTLAKDRMAGRAKRFFGVVEVGMVVVVEEEDDQMIFGWEAAGELLDSGVELRSEGGVFYDELLDDWHNAFIVGADYGLSGGVTILGEYLHNSGSDDDNLAARLSWLATPLLSTSFLVITNLHDFSKLFSPVLQYSLSDEMSLEMGMFIYTGEPGERYSADSMLFGRWFVQL